MRPRTQRLFHTDENDQIVWWTIELIVLHNGQHQWLRSLLNAKRQWFRSVRNHDVIDQQINICFARGHDGVALVTKRIQQLSLKLSHTRGPAVLAHERDF